MRYLFLGLLLCAGAAFAGDLSGYAFVQDDGSLRIKGRTVELYGIYVPPTDEDCFTFVRPPICGPRATLGLKFKIGADFVHCQIKARKPHALVGLCKADGDDLGAWLLREGWALARPDAPFEYQALEKIARRQGRGLWGIPGHIPP